MPFKTFIDLRQSLKTFTKVIFIRKRILNYLLKRNFLPTFMTFMTFYHNLPILPLSIFRISIVYIVHLLRAIWAFVFMENPYNGIFFIFGLLHRIKQCCNLLVDIPKMNFGIFAYRGSQ
jgi:hypothetical protein